MERGRGHRASDTQLSHHPGVPEGIGFKTIVHPLSFKEQVPPSTPVWAEQKLQDAGDPSSTGVRGNSRNLGSRPDLSERGRWPNDVLTRATSISPTVLKQPRFSPSSHLPVTASDAFPRYSIWEQAKLLFQDPSAPRWGCICPHLFEEIAPAILPFVPTPPAIPSFLGHSIRVSKHTHIWQQCMDPDPCTLNVFYVKSPQAQKHRTPNESDLLKTLLLGQKGCSIDRKIASATFLLLHVFLMFLGPSIWQLSSCKDFKKRTWLPPVCAEAFLEG